MSDIVKLNIRKKNIRAIISDNLVNPDGFTELPEVIEREKQEHAHKIDLENAYSKGYEEGRIETSTLLDEKHSGELLNQSQSFYQIISSFEEKLKVYENDYHKLVIKVAEKISKKIIEKEIDENSNIEKTLEKSLKKIIGANDIMIKLSPEDYERIEKTGKEYFASSGISKIRFELSNNIKSGGCLIESEIGNIDARIETQIGEIIKDLENYFINKEEV